LARRPSPFPIQWPAQAFEVPPMKTMKMVIYFAGPLFTTAEREFNAALARELGHEHEVLLPQEWQDLKTPSKKAFRSDVKAIDRADVIVANMDGPDPDSGTCWECGYAYAREMPIVLYRTDFRKITDGEAPFNLMLSESATELIHPSDVEGRTGYSDRIKLAKRINEKLQTPSITRAVARQRKRRLRKRR
jgi:nucleoside 2-deoxyribosyltransferase